MIIYTVKIPIEKSMEKDWFTWMSLVHIPEVINTGHFLDYTFMKLICSEEAETKYITYEIQYVCPTRKDLEAYLNDEAEGIRAKHLERYKDYLDIPNISRTEYFDMTETGQRIMAAA